MHPESRKVSLGKEAIKLARDCILHGRDFSVETTFLVETTLAGGNAICLIRDAKANKFEFTMFYVGLVDYHLYIERVAVLFRNGGHHIPTEDIVRRHDINREFT